MKWRSGPRPWSIHAFALLVIIAGLYGLHRDIGAAETTASHMMTFAPWIEWNRDWAIVLASALFTIVLIPVAAIWAFASRIARNLVVLMALPVVLHLYQLIETALWSEQVFNPLPMAFAALRLSAVVLLFTPSSLRWLSPVQEVGPETFA